MTIEPWYWMVFTIVAAAAQAGRNAMQRELTAVLGTAGATQVRFLYGLPFAVLFCASTLAFSGESLPIPSALTIAWAFLGGMAQVIATALMLAAMREKSFVVTTALTKIEPVWVAVFGLVFLGDTLSSGLVFAIMIATAGVLVMSWPGSASQWALRPVLLGLTSGAVFAVAAIGFRGAIRSLPTEHFVVAASAVLVLGLAIQTLLLVAWMGWRERALLRAVLGAWRPSIATGLLAAIASQGWFLAFAVETAARVRTLALVEILFAQLISRRLFRQGLSRNEWLGLGLLLVGVAWVLRT